jgi:hypothetical protein
MVVKLLFRAAAPSSPKWARLGDGLKTSFAGATRGIVKFVNIGETLRLNCAMLSSCKLNLSHNLEWPPQPCG